jgi:rhamnose transport system permease protein
MYVDRGRELSIVVFLAAIAALLLVVVPSFFNATNLNNILINVSYVAIGALGQMAVILTGQPDISVGSVLAVCAMSAGAMATAGLPVAVVVLLTILIGATLGLINGLLITSLGIHSIIVTLGTLGIYRGGLLYFTGGAWIYNLPPSFRWIALGDVAGVANPIWIAALTMVVFSFVLTRTRWGRSLYAVGSNDEAARLSGLSRNRVLVSAFTLNGAMVAIAAMVYATRFSTIQSNIGLGYEFLVITAVVVGGAHIFGGSGTVIGVVLGALLVAITGTVLVFLAVSAFWERSLHGAFILLAVGFEVVRQRVRRKRSAPARAAP